MKYILLVLVVVSAFCLSACEGPRVRSNTENLNMVVIPFNNKDMAKAVETLKENMVFFRVKNKCFGCVFTESNGRARPSLVEVSCESLLPE